MFLNYKTEQKYESTKIIYEDLFYMKNTIIKSVFMKDYILQCRILSFIF